MRIENNGFRPVPQFFQEGARTTAEKVTALIATLLAVAASFFYLPIEAAVAISAGLGFLFSTVCCLSDEDIPIDQQRWYHPVLYAAPRIINWAFAYPVVNPGFRAGVGAGHQQEAPILQNQRRIPVNGVPVLPVNQLQGEPPEFPPQHNLPRAPVGHGHR